MNKQTYNYLTRQGTPEDAKRIENNNKIELAQRRVNARKKYGLDVSEEDLAIINNGQIQTKKQFIENLPIDERPGYDPDKDNNLLRRLRYWGGLEGQNYGKEFDKAIAQEDLALKKLGEKQKNILQRNKKTEVKKSLLPEPKVQKPVAANIPLEQKLKEAEEGLRKLDILKDPEPTIEEKIKQMADATLKAKQDLYDREFIRGGIADLKRPF